MFRRMNPSVRFPLFAIDVVVPGQIFTQGYTQIFCLCYGYKWMTFQGVVVKDILFFPSLSYYVAFIVVTTHAPGLFP